MRKSLGIEDGSSYTSVGLFLHAGNLESPFVFKTRKYLYYENCGWISDGLKRFKKALSSDNNICIWYSSKDTDEYLGMLATVDYLSDKGKKIWLCDYSGICLIMPYIHEVDGPFDPPDRHIMNREEQERYQTEWHRFQKTNAPLRIMDKNNKIVDCNEDYIDKAIFDFVGNDEIRVSAICEEMLIHHIHFGLTFIEYRLHRLIEAGEFEVIKQGMTDAVIGGPAPYFPFTIIKRIYRKDTE